MVVWLALPVEREAMVLEQRRFSWVEALLGNLDPRIAFSARAGALVPSSVFVPRIYLARLDGPTERLLGQVPATLIDLANQSAGS